MTFELESLGVCITARAATWTALGMAWQVKPISPNYGKAVVIGAFESADWLGDIMIWVSGEAELATLRPADGWIVNKHYDLESPGDLDSALDEVASLVASGTVPAGALTAWDARRRS